MKSNTPINSGKCSTEVGQPETSPPRADNVVPCSQSAQISALLFQLATLEQRMTGKDEVAKWSKRFNKRFHVGSVEALEPDRLQAATLWLTNRLREMDRSLKRRDSSLMRKDKHARIKSKMHELQKGAEKEIFYRDVSQALKLKRTFRSLKDLSEPDLDRVLVFVERMATPTC